MSAANRDIMTEGHGIGVEERREREKIRHRTKAEWKKMKEEKK